MRSRRPRALQLALLVLPALPAAGAAQTSYRVGLSGGAYHASVIDPTSSELRYSGGGPALGLSLTRVSAGSVLELQADYQRSRLTSSLTSGDVPREQVTLAGVRATALLGQHALAGGRLRPGLALQGDLAVRDHWYAQPPVAFSYLIATGALGPAARWTRSLGRGELRADAAVPLLGLVYRPYSDLESVDGDRRRVRFVALDRLQAPAAEVAWAVPVGGVRAVAGWRFRYLRYRDDTVYRQAWQSLWAALELPLGGGR